MLERAAASRYPNLGGLESVRNRLVLQNQPVLTRRLQGRIALLEGETCRRHSVDGPTQLRQVIQERALDVLASGYQYPLPGIGNSVNTRNGRRVGANRSNGKCTRKRRRKGHKNPFTNLRTASTRMSKDSEWRQSAGQVSTNVTNLRPHHRARVSIAQRV